MKNNMWYCDKKYIISIIILMSINIMAQTNEVGVFIGGSLFHGDIGHIKAENSIKDTRLVYGLEFKRNFNYHFGVHLSLKRGEIYAADENSSDLFVLTRNLSFKSKISEIGLIAEFNFKPYISRDNDYTSAPFVFAGITQFYFNPQALSDNGIWYNLRPLNTEGQESDLYPTRKLYDLNGISIPFGIGYKIKLYNMITINLKWSWRITKTDYIDDVSQTYVEDGILSNVGEQLSNQSNIAFQPGFQRGNPNNNDKYGFFGISIMYSIKDPNKGCDNITY